MCSTQAPKLSCVQDLGLQCFSTVAQQHSPGSKGGDCALKETAPVWFDEAWSACLSPTSTLGYVGHQVLLSREGISSGAEGTITATMNCYYWTTDIWMWLFWNNVTNSNQRHVPQFGLDLNLQVAHVHADRGLLWIWNRPLTNTFQHENTLWDFWTMKMWDYQFPYLLLVSFLGHPLHLQTQLLLLDAKSLPILLFLLLCPALLLPLLLALLLHLQYTQTMTSGLKCTCVGCHCGTLGNWDRVCLNE